MVKNKFNNITMKRSPFCTVTYVGYGPKLHGNDEGIEAQGFYQDKVAKDIFENGFLSKYVYTDHTIRYSTKKAVDITITIENDCSASIQGIKMNGKEFVSEKKYFIAEQILTLEELAKKVMDREPLASTFAFEEKDYQSIQEHLATFKLKEPVEAAKVNFAVNGERIIALHANQEVLKNVSHSIVKAPLNITVIDHKKNILWALPATTGLKQQKIKENSPKK